MSGKILRQIEGWASVDARHPLWGEHFPAAPVAPGSLVVNFFIARINDHLAQESLSRAVRKIGAFRFHAFAGPGDYNFRIEFSEDFMQARCLLYDSSGRLAASGILSIEFRQQASKDRQ